MALTETHEATAPAVLTPEERNFALAQRQATALANSDIVPKVFAGNVANCLIALNLAQRVGCDPLMAMQNIDVIHGRPTWRSTFLIAAVNKCGRFTPLRYRIEGEGDARTCVAVANERETGEEIEGPPVSMEMAKAEGWSTKSGSKWKTMPDLMLRYRAAAFFARTVAPEVAMGLYTSDEIEDMDRPTSTGASAKSATEAIANAKDVTPPAEEPEQTEGERVRDDVDAAFFGTEEVEE
jgi:hypothetical protein